jgi:FdhD protein
MNQAEKVKAMPPDGVEKVVIQRATRESKETVEDAVVRELPLTIMLNGTELVTLLCSPSDIKYLAIGFLFSEGILKQLSDLKRVIVDDRKGVVRVETVLPEGTDTEAVFKRIITPGCGRGASFYSAADTELPRNESRLTVAAGTVLDRMTEFQRHSELYRTTHGVHSAALCDEKGILIFQEDIGRHNAIDKIFGQCFEQSISTQDKYIVSSGRISSEIVIKIARGGTPVLVTKSAPTNTAVKMADDLGVTLVGMVRGTHMNIYTHDERVTVGGTTEK